MEMDKIVRDFKGVWIDKAIWLDHNLTWMEKLMITEINSLDNDKGCWASNNYLAGFFNLSASRISQIINNLIQKCYITVTYNYRKNSKEIESRVLKILNTGIKNTKGGIKNTKGGYLENAEGINTKINNTINNTEEVIKDNPLKTLKKKYREFISLTEKEHNRLVNEYGKINTDNAMDFLDNYKGESEKNRKKYKGADDNRILRRWVFTAIGAKKLGEHEKTKTCPECGKEYEGFCRCKGGTR